MTLGERVKLLRTQKGLTQVEFGKQISASGATVSTTESGKTTPDNQTIAAICGAFNVSEQWLRTGKGEMFLVKPREQELADFFASVLSVDPPDTRACLIHALSKLSVPQWEALTDVINTMVADWETQKNRPHE